MFSLFNHRAEPTDSCRTTSQPAAMHSAQNEDASAAERPATYDEVYPYLLLAMVTAI